MLSPDFWWALYNIVFDEKMVCNIQSQFKEVCSTQGVGVPSFVSYHVSFLLLKIFLEGEANLIMQVGQCRRKRHFLGQPPNCLYVTQLC